MTALAKEQTIGAKISKPSDREIRIERVFNASRDRV
jgi:hypothetical protein